jgi:hypothetical protein
MLVRHGRQAILLTLVATSLLFLTPTMVFGQDNGTLDLGSLLPARDPETMISGLKGEMQEKVKDRWIQLVMGDSQTAEVRNLGDLYPNPSIQAYVNRLGQSLIPKEASENVFVSFKIVADPLPYADSLATGTVYLSTGMISLLENESQLAFLLMHEAGHVILSHHLHQIIDEEKAERRANRIRLIGAAAGALAGGVLGGSRADVAFGGLVGFAGAEQLGVPIAAAFRNHRFMRQIQLESDQFATQILLQNGFDVREAPTLMAKVGDIVRRSGAAVDLAFGNASDLPQRSAKITELLGGPYLPVVDRILKGDGFRMSSPRYSHLMSELKRDNGLLALKRDLFIIARTNLEEAAAVRTDDPLTMYGLGVLYRTVGRTNGDMAKASNYLKSAMEFDEVRHRFPEVHLQYAVELLSREDPQRYPEIQKELKSYVVLYQRNAGGNLPREMRFVYDYLDLTGDRSWIAYEVDNVSSEVPYQLTGDAKIDGSIKQAEKRLPKK